MKDVKRQARDPRAHRGRRELQRIVLGVDRRARSDRFVVADHRQRRLAVARPPRLPHRPPISVDLRDVSVEMNGREIRNAAAGHLERTGTIAIGRRRGRDQNVGLVVHALRKRAKLGNAGSAVEAVLPGFVRDFEVHDLLLAADRHRQERVDQLLPIGAVGNVQLAVADQRPFHAKPVLVEREIGQARDHVGVIGPVPIDRATVPEIAARRIADHAERAEIMKAVLR